MKTSIGILILTLIKIGFTASAIASPVHADALENDAVDVVIPLSPSKVEAEVQSEQIQRDRENAPKTNVEAGISTWIPKNLDTPSRLSGVTAYSSTGVPAININVMNPLSSSFNLKVGAGFLTTHRYASLSLSGQALQEEETATVISARVGVEYLPAFINTPVFRPYLSAGILPTVVMTNRTALDDGNNYLGLPVELSVGSLIAFTKTLGLNVGVTETLGSVNNSNISGLGVDAMVRLPL